MSNTVNENIVKLIELFSREDASLLDPLMKNNEILKGASVANRHFVGIIPQKKQQQYEIESRPYLCKKIQLITDPEQTPSYANDLIITEIPRYDFDDESVNDYDNTMQTLARNLKYYYMTRLNKDGYLIIITTDQRYQSRYYAPHMLLGTEFESTDATLQSVITILSEDKPLKPLGYPSTYVPNIINQHVLVFKKPY